MLPRLQIAVRRDEFRDFAILEFLASRRYRAPPPERALFPELAYRVPRRAPRTPAVAAVGLVTLAPAEGKKTTGRSRDHATMSDAGLSATPVNTTSDTRGGPPARVSSTTKCWNCAKLGHIARECGEDRRVYCYRCGRGSFTVKTCPTCSGNEKASR